MWFMEWRLQHLWSLSPGKKKVKSTSGTCLIWRLRNSFNVQLYCINTLRAPCKIFNFFVFLSVFKQTWVCKWTEKWVSVPWMLRTIMTNLKNIKSIMAVQHLKFCLSLGRILFLKLCSCTSYHLGALEDVNRKYIVSIDFMS